MTRKYIGACRWVGVVAGLTLVGAAGCGDGFSAHDCMANRTCMETGGQGSAEGGAGATSGTAAISGAGEPGAGASDGGDTGGADGAGDMGGAGGADTGCHTAADCSNDDPADGEELCSASGVCLPGNAPPTVVSITPKDGAIAVEPDGTIVIQFSEALDPKSVTKTTIEVLDGKTPVPGEPVYADNQVTFTPTAPLALLGDYTVSVTTDVTDDDGAHLLEAFSSKFSIRDGVWHTAIDAVNDLPGSLSDALPMRASGEVLLAWAGSNGVYCPATARWFLRGVAVPPMAKAFACSATSNDANGVSSGANDAGIGAVVWNVPDSQNGNYVGQFRGGQWQATAPIVSKDYNASRFRLAVAPTGVVTLFESSIGTTAWRSDADGAWPANGDPVSTLEAEGSPSVAFDSKGDGLAVWAAKDQSTGFERIVASHYTTTSGKWAPAIDLPGSVATFKSADVQRGAPAVAFTPDGDALVLWVKATILMASHFSKQSWSDPETVSGALTVNSLQWPPGLAFDGKDFVAAWTAKDVKQYTYTARYDLKAGWSTYEQRQAAAADGTSMVRMPRLASEGRGDLMLVWAMGTAPNFTLKYQRYAAGAWSTIQNLPGGSVTNNSFEFEDLTPLSANASGLAAIAWANRATTGTNTGLITTIRLASFH